MPVQAVRGGPAAASAVASSALAPRGWPKRTLSQPSDPLEREADGVAESVMRSLGRPRPEASAGAPVAPPAPASGGGGQPLPADLRRQLEPRFGFDFRRVRIHADSQAAASAAAFEANAYTSGGDIVFAAGRYAPSTWDGQKLLAHELAHVVQQGQAGAAPGGQLQRQCTACAAEEDEGVIQRQAARPARAARPAGPIVENGQPAGAGQMHRSELLAALGASLAIGTRSD